MCQPQSTCFDDRIGDPEFPRLGPVRGKPIELIKSWGRGVAEDEMVRCKMESSFNLFAPPDKLDFVYLKLVSVSLIAGSARLYSGYPGPFHSR